MENNLPEEVVQKEQKEEEVEELISEKSDNIITELQKELKKITHDVVRLETQYNELHDIFLELSSSEKKLRLIEKNFITVTQDMIEPLETLTGFFQIMKSHNDNLTKVEIKSFAERMDVSVKNMLITLENLVQWCKLEKGKIEFKPEAINLNRAVLENILFFEQIADRKNITITSDIFNNVFVMADRNMLNYILRNLISNSIKFTRQGGNVSIAAKVLKKFVEVNITDNGVGISEQNLKKIFKTDNHFTTLGTDKEKGNGLGLLSCKEFILKQSGKIRIESELNKGTSVIFTLPLADKK